MSTTLSPTSTTDSDVTLYTAGVNDLNNAAGTVSEALSGVGFDWMAIG